MKKKPPITAIVLTFNEQNNIRACLNSIYDFVDEIILVDSYSTDNTLKIVEEYEGVRVFQHPFENYAKQRNWAFANTQPRNSFIFNLDADHRPMKELFDELSGYFEKGIPDDVNGFIASRRALFLGKWVRYGGHYPVYHGIVFRKNKGFCEDKEYDQHFVIEGKTITLKNDVIDILAESLTVFTERHNKWATLEAKEIFKEQNQEGKIQAKKDGNAMEIRRYQRLKYYKLPIFFRVFLYFFYRFVWKGGFRDGKQGLIFHFLQGFWFRFLVDAKLWEMQNASQNASVDTQ